MEIKIQNEHLGQVRVYVLPDDVGRGLVDREQLAARKSMQLLLSRIDISNSTWKGEWSTDTPVAHADASLDEQSKDASSLFYLFNTLPSPKPDAEIVLDQYAGDAMRRILKGDLDGLITEMYPYQRSSAAMMLQREAQPSQMMDPRLRRMVDQKGSTWYFDSDAGLCLTEPRTYETAKGGILAETMGLGKTLICLALILATREFSSQCPVEHSVGRIPIRHTTGSLKDMAAATIGRTGTPWKSYFAAMEAEGYDFSQCMTAIKEGAGYYYLPGPQPRRKSRKPVEVPSRKIWLSTATIVVVPSNLVSQWVTEINKHTTGLKVLVMSKESKKKQKLPPAKELAEYDIILFSKPRFDEEAADGSDALGRRKSNVSNVCRCPYIGSTRDRDCTCFKEEDAYRSPLKDIRFKRIITDEGHNFGNATNNSKTEAVTVVSFLELESRWIVSGTPTQGLYGAEVSLSNSENASSISTPRVIDHEDGFPAIPLAGSLPNSLSTLSEPSAESLKEQEAAFYKQERKDLEKLGNIATVYLKARPWANTALEGDEASWSQHVLQPRHTSKSHGNMDCLKSTLEWMIIRHRPEDVERDVVLPPLHQDVIYLDGSIQDKLSLNMFSMAIVSNAVTSERKDVDYLFHTRQRKALNELVLNLRQASFHWSGFSSKDIQAMMDTANKFLEKGEVPIAAADEVLLRQAIRVGEIVLANDIKKVANEWHEMPMYIQNEFPEDVRAAWALDADSRNPTLMGATMVHAAQNFVSSQMWKEDPMEGLVGAGRQALQAAHSAANHPPTTRSPKKKGKDLKSPKKALQLAPALAGGVKVASEGAVSKKRSRASSISAPLPCGGLTLSNLTSIDDLYEDLKLKTPNDSMASTTTNPKSALKTVRPADLVLEHNLEPTSPLASATIVSTSSAKLSYLLDRIVLHKDAEKILVFYESDNVAFYIAQALECLHIEHLIYAKSLPSDRKAKYVVLFNQIEHFRVLLMDISQAAFGLDMSSASRVFFINPVFSPQIEAQAVKRAHRIGQTKPVYVETLVLEGSIEEVIIDRRKDMTNEEHNRCKSILDDSKMFDWIRNVSFLPVSAEEVPGPEQMAKLATAPLVFNTSSILDVSAREVTSIGADESLDASLHRTGMSEKAKGKRKVMFGPADEISESEGSVTTEVPQFPPRELEPLTIRQTDVVMQIEPLRRLLYQAAFPAEYYALRPRGRFSTPEPSDRRRTPRPFQSPSSSLDVEDGEDGSEDDDEDDPETPDSRWPSGGRYGGPDDGVSASGTRTTIRENHRARRNWRAAQDLAGYTRGNEYEEDEAEDGEIDEIERFETATKNFSKLKTID